MNENQFMQNIAVKETYIDMQAQNPLSAPSIRLFSCTAWVYYTDKYIVLKSYNTIIAWYDTYSGALYDGLRYVYGYTATSAQHIAKFKRVLPDKPTAIYTYRE